MVSGAEVATINFISYTAYQLEFQYNVFQKKMHKMIIYEEPSIAEDG